MKAYFLVALAAPLCFAVPMACGSSDSNPTSSGGGQTGGGTAAGAGTPAVAGGGTGGSGGASGGTGGVMLPPGTTSMPTTIQCGGDCTSARVGLVYADPCCGGENGAVCGVDTTYLTMTGAAFKPGCEPKHQPGALNAACPSPEPSKIDVGMGTMAALDPFPGCCRPNGTCGVEMNTVTAGGGLLPIADLGFGCVDATSFFPGAAAVPCTEAAGGAGSGGAGGAP